MNNDHLDAGIDLTTTIRHLTTLLADTQRHNETLAATRRHLVRQARRQGHTLQALADATGLDQSRISRIAAHIE